MGYEVENSEPNTSILCAQYEYVGGTDYIIFQFVVLV